MCIFPHSFCANFSLLGSMNDFIAAFVAKVALEPFDKIRISSTKCATNFQIYLYIPKLPMQYNPL